MYEYLDNGENLTAVSSWGDNMFSIRTGDINYVRKEHFWHVYDSCIEYKCSRSYGTKNDTTRVDFGISNLIYCYYYPGFHHLHKPFWDHVSFSTAPTLDPTDLPSGFFYSNTTSVQPDINDCLASANYSGALPCYYYF